MVYEWQYELICVKINLPFNISLSIADRKSTILRTWPNSCAEEEIPSSLSLADELMTDIRTDQQQRIGILTGGVTLLQEAGGPTKNHISGGHPKTDLWIIGITQNLNIHTSGRKG